MKRLLQLFAAVAFAVVARPLAAQSDDPSEVFLKAYMTSQSGEKLEHDNQLSTALSKFKSAGALLETLKKGHADWQPAIVDYRSRKVSESILRVEGKMATQKDLVSATTDPGPVSPPILPGNGGPAEPESPASASAPALPQLGGGVDGSFDLVTPRADVHPTAKKAVTEKSNAAPSETAIKDATKQLQGRVEQLEAELVKSKKEFASVQKEKENLSGRLQETNAKLQKAQGEIEKAQQAEKEVHGQLAAAQESLEKVKASGTAKAQEALRAEIAQLKKALASAEQGRAAAEKEKGESDAKVASVTKERDELLEQLKVGKQAQERVQVLVAENTALQQQLAQVEEKFHDIGSDKPRKAEQVAEVQQQIEQLRQQLAEKDKQNQEFEVTIADLRSQLDAATSELNKAKLAGANAEETARLTRENEILRNIVLRERQEEARREQARKLMLAEFDKLQIKSETLNKQIALLAQPVTKLSTEELALLRQPVVAISDNNPGGMTASFAMPKPSDDPKPSIEASPEGQPQQVPDSVQTAPKPAVPDELVPVAREAKTNFDNGKYHNAERQYQQILAKVPNNLYALSNLGVVYFRTGKLKAAELTLKKAVALDSKDEFSHRTLGIVYYGEAKYDDAVTELTRALAINPKSFIAHNYLGITASQKGWQEAAEKEMNEAIAANPDYADAHYNLAVIYATAQPPSKEQAKLHYARATALGVEADPSLERLLR